MRKIISGLFLSALLTLGVVGGQTLRAANAAEISNDRSGHERQEIIRGLLHQFGSDFVVVDGSRYRTAPRVEIKNAEGEVVTSGMKGLRPQAMVELVLEGHLVVQIQVVSLPR